MSSTLMAGVVAGPLAGPFGKSGMHEIAIDGAGEGTRKKASHKDVGPVMAGAPTAPAVQNMLLITPMTGAENCAALLTRQLGLPVEVARSRRAGLCALRRAEFGMVLVDEAVVAADPQGTDLLWQHAGLAVPMTVNFASVGGTQLVREVRQAMLRREREFVMARHAAAVEMQSEFKSAVTALLLQSELALNDARLSPALEEKLRGVVALASGLRERLRPTA